MTDAEGRHLLRVDEQMTNQHGCHLADEEV